MRALLTAALVVVIVLAGCAGRPGNDRDQRPEGGTPGGSTGNSTPPPPAGNTTKPPTNTSGDGMTPPADNGTRNVEEMLGGDLEVTGTDVAYTANRTGYLAQPNTGGPYPGVVMIHEWWGLNPQIEQAARLLASHGYAVLAVDLFGTVATTQPEALAQVRAYDATLGLENMRDAAVWLREDADATSVTSLGWCFGGGQSLLLALSGEQLAGTVIYYGQLVNDTSRLERLDWPVLGIFGGADTSIPVKTVWEFDAALNATAVPHDIHVYPGVGHAFANPSGANWAPEETADAWAKTLAFLDENAR